MGNMTDITLQKMLQRMAWEQVKCYLNTILVVYDDDKEQLTKLYKIIKDFIKQYPNILRNSSFNVYLRAHKENLKGQDLIHTKMKVILPFGKFIADGEDWGAEYSVKDCLQKIETQIIRKYDIQKDKRETWKRKNRRK